MAKSSRPRGSSKTVSKQGKTKERRGDFSESPLVDFYQRIASRRGTNRSRANTRSKSIADIRDFDALSSLMFDLMPDPDEVLKKAGLNASVYRDCLTDAHVSGSLMQRKSKTKLMELQIVAGDPKDAKSKAARDMVEQQIKKMNRVPNVINEMLEAPFFGAAHFELVWSREPMTTDKPSGEIVLQNIVGKPFEWFVWDLDGVLKIRSDMMMGGNTPMSAEDIPVNKVYSVVKDGTYLNPYGDRIAKRVYWPYLFKKGGLRFWTEFIEKYGSPFIFGKADPAKNSSEVEDFFNALVDMVRNGVVVTQAGSQKDEIEVIESKDKSASTDAYKSYKNAMNIEISKSVLGETLTIENSETGSQAATETHLSVLESLQAEDRQMVENGFNGIFKIMTVLNFGEEVEAPRALLVDRANLNEKLAARDSILCEKLSVKFSKGYISKTYNIDEEDFEISEPVAPPAVPGMKDPNGETMPAKDGTKPPKKETGAAQDETNSGGGSGDQSNPDKSPTFAERTLKAENLKISDAINAYVEDSLKRFEKLTEPLRLKVAEIIKTSKNFEEFSAAMVTIQSDFDEGLFAHVFQESLAVAELVGEWAVTHDRA